nr:hypothetical protein [Spirosoma spitsbergense]
MSTSPALSENTLFNGKLPVIVGLFGGTTFRISLKLPPSRITGTTTELVRKL